MFLGLPCEDLGDYRTFGKYYDRLLHLGHDINNHENCELEAVSDGEVLGVFFVDGYGSLNPTTKGYTMFILHDDDNVYQYGHILPLVKEGDNVFKGQLIGHIAHFENQGISLPHCHFGKCLQNTIPTGYWGYSRDGKLGNWTNPLV